MGAARQLLVCLNLMCITIISHADQLSVAVASNFTAAMRQLGDEFEETTGHSLNVSYGSSGKFYAQIRHGAPFQVFLSADQTKPEALIKEGLVTPKNRFTYAVGALALWSSKSDFVDENGEVLRSGHFNKLALANPLLAPYGIAALDVLRHLSLENSTRNSWVKGENIAQTYQFVSTGNADIGFVAVSQIMENGELKSGSAWIVPPKLYRPIKQDAVLLKAGENSVAATEFIAFLKSEKAKTIIRTFGYGLVE
ncbi:molybdate ABC transporter substrate-binding protein [uncultured Zhongshania sp.]|uniref:molybdate ABC transporter substrate-binding protein n=1 Tax=uncultured Zhongshania sp. TaxID=1642288 RepID=UPI0025DFF267|nr:molybdate ABC transporter substrate-binding protein [uncultured Zhongshania sp.]